MVRIAVLGASGLIGEALTRDLLARGHRVTALARHATASQRATLAAQTREMPLAELSARDLAMALANHDLVVNALGVLQDSGKGLASHVNHRFVLTLIEALQSLPQPKPFLVHISIPGKEEEDDTAFAITKRAAERDLAASSLNHIILRPGFVIAPTAFGGSALVRALASLPVTLPAELSTRPFQITAMSDIGRCVAAICTDLAAGRQPDSGVYDVMSLEESSVGEVIEAFRFHFGGPMPRLALPPLLMQAGAKLGDAVSRLGWRPPIRSTALAEMRRGVAGDPSPWMRAQRLTPLTLPQALNEVPASVQEKWFARLYLLKPLLIGTLSLFWIASGAIALARLDQAASILTTGGLSPLFSKVTTLITSLADMGIGCAIATRRHRAFGLGAGMALTLCYLAGSLILMPALWLDPLGPLVKVFPMLAAVLAALAVLDER